MSRDDSGPATFPAPPTEEQLESPEADVVAEEIRDDRRERSLAALDDAVDCLHDRLDDELTHDPEGRTAREYVREERGWTDETIDALRIGYTPPNPRSLWDHLESAGHEQDAIFGTGLFRGRCDPVWKGRIVLPYPDETGERAAFAISRRIPGRKGGDTDAERLDAHPADYNDDAKYHKIRTTYSYVHVEEPIFGAHTVADGQPLIITEGIADAITAHQAGLPCLSPVTVRFKHGDRERVRDLLADRNVPRIYLINDAEPPSSDTTDEKDGWESLNLTRVGPGLAGALDTAAFLAGADGVTDDVRIADLPTPAGGKAEADAAAHSSVWPDKTDAETREYLAEQASGGKVDLDDYLVAWDGDIRPVLAGAAPVHAHPRYDEAALSPSARRATDADAAATDTEPTTAAAGANRTASRASTGTYSGGPPPGEDGERSALFDLDVADLTGYGAGYRADESPFGHHGDSRGYWSHFRQGGDVLAHDHKHKATYTALTYLLCETGDRSPSTPEGPLDDREVFVAWREAKERGVLPADDPIPHRALVHVALDAGLCDRADVTDGWKLPREAYNDALALVRDGHDIDPGRSRLSVFAGDGDADPVAVLPLDQLDALWRVNPEQAKRYARRHGLSWPETDEVREELASVITEAMQAEETVVVDAPTSIGKSYDAATRAWTAPEYASVTGDKPVAHLHKTRDARDEAIADSAAAGIDYAVVRSRTEVCPVCAGDHDPAPPDAKGEGEERDPDVVLTVNGVPASVVIDNLCGTDDRPGKGFPVSVAHAFVAANNDQGRKLPCEANDTECRLHTQWDGIPRTDDGEPAADVIHATHQFAHVPSLRANTNLIFDEQPDFSVDLSTDQLQRAVGAFLREVGAPAETWGEFVTLARHDGYEGDAAVERDATKKAIEKTPDREWFLSHPDAHTLAPALARATWWALRDDPDANGRLSGTAMHEPPRLDANANPDAGWNREVVSVVLRADRGRVEVETVRDAPDLSQARSVVGLDAHPTMHLWQRNARPGMTRRAVLDPAERALWRRFERGLTVVQLGDATRPAGGDGQYLRYDGDDGADPLRVIIKHLRKHYGEEFRTGITASKAEEYFEAAMRECGIDDPETMHYGEEKSRNDFADELVGLVNGCIDPGDDYVVNLLAECGLDAQPTTEPCEQCGGDGCGHAEPDCHDGERRARGREFVGPDADAAVELLASVRENHVAQAAGRYARNPDDPESRAVVFVRTDATPPGFVDYHAPDVAWAATDTQREIIETANDAGYIGATAKAVAEATGASKRHVATTLRRLAEAGHATIREGAGKYGADVFRVVNAPTYGVADLPDQIANDPVWDSYTWSFAIRPADQPGGPPPSANGGDSVATDDPATANGGGGHDPPPS